MVYLLGIDQGGSKTVAAIADARGNLLGVGMAAGGQHCTVGMREAMAYVAQAVVRARASAGLGEITYRAVYAGLSGADFPEDYAALRQGLGEALGVAEPQVVNDCIIAMRTGLTRRAGAILCAGSGLNCAVRDARGAEYIFGYAIHDRYQGGGALAERALWAVFDAQSCLGSPTLLTERLLAHFGAQDADALLQRYTARALPEAQCLALTRVLDACAIAGDAVSQDILRGFAQDCARIFAAGMRKVGMTDGALELVVSGGVFKCRSPLLLDTLRGCVAADYPSVRLVEAAWEPVVGGVLLGLDEVYGQASLGADVLRAVQASCARLGLLRRADKEEDRA